VIIDERILVYPTKYVATSDVVTNLIAICVESFVLRICSYLKCCRSKVPLHLPIKSVGVDSTGYINGIRELLDGLYCTSGSVLSDKLDR